MPVIGLIAAIPVASIAIAWAFGAVWFDAPFGAGNRLAAALLAITFVVVLLFVRPFWRKLVIFVVLFAGVLIWWLTLSPTSDVVAAARGISKSLSRVPNEPPA